MKTNSPWNRREFLRTASAATLGFGGGLRAPVAGQEAEPKIKPTADTLIVL